MADETKAQTGLRGAELLRAVVNQILDHPETWNQKSWHCGTTHCVAGWCQLIGAGKEDTDTCSVDAEKLLGVSSRDADWLFDANRKLPDIHAFAKALISGDVHFNRGGYNRGGYNRDGYNRDGYNRDGYDRGGYNRDGYNRDGYNRDGYNRGGYNRDGYNRDGYDRGGYNRGGYNRDGYDRDGYKLHRL